MPSTTVKFFLYTFLVLLVFTIGCKQPPPIANKFYEHYKNPIYKDFDTAAYNAEFKKQLSVSKPQLRYAELIAKYYNAHTIEPHFTDQFLLNGQLSTLVQYLNKANEHGLNASVFKADKIVKELNKIKANRFTAISEVYPVLARLEIEAANSLLTYSSMLQYGVVNPHTLYGRYNMKIKRPDSLFINQIYKTDNLNVYLEQIQPKNPAYLALKKALADINTDVVDSDKIQRLRLIKLNMERLRWQTTAKESRYLWVNIPAFNLQWVENGKPVFDMKVCVGEPKPADYAERLKKYLETKNIDDKPLNHETTILNSRISTIQLNPTWNIPNSIAQNEIYFAIQRNPDYLTNNNIKVYYKDKLVTDPDTIRWERISRQKMPYKFKQDASDLNALGKFKFIFDNENSIYLHDTPNKRAFTKGWRAVSHGCVRVQDPLKLTEALINDTSRVDEIRMEVGLQPQNLKDTTRYKAIQAKRSAAGFELKSKYVELKPDMQLFIDYYTCWPGEDGKPVFYSDAYRMDAPLEKAMGKYLSK